MRILISGGGDLGRFTAEMLADSGHELRVVELSREVCERIVAKADIMVLCGDGTRPEMLEKAEIDKADIVIALTGDDKSNLITAFIAKEYGVKRVIIKLNDPSLNIVCLKLGIEEIINPKVATANHISEVVVAPHALDLSTLVGGSVRAFSAIIKDDGFAGKHISELDLPEDCSPVVLKRESEFLIVKSDIKLLEGDRLEFLCEEKSLDTLRGLFG